MRVINWFKQNYNLREDAHVRVAAIIPAIVALNLGLYFTSGENVTSGLYCGFLVYLLFGVDIIARLYSQRQDRKNEREAEQLLRAEEFGDRLDKSFGLDK